MQALKIVGSILVVVLVVLLFAAPLGPLPGIFIGGTAAPVPASWGDTRPIHEIQLQVGEGLIRRVVIIWVVQVDGLLHVVGAKDSGWTAAIGGSGPVRMRLGDETYDMQATLMTTGWQPVLEAYVDKYREDYPEIIDGFPSIDEAEGAVSVFQLLPRKG